MTRLPAPAWLTSRSGGRSHRVNRFTRVLEDDSWVLSVRCHQIAGCTWLDGNTTSPVLTGTPTRPVCRVCEPRRRSER